MNPLELLQKELQELKRKKKSAEYTIQLCETKIEELEDVISTVSGMERYTNE